MKRQSRKKGVGAVLDIMLRRILLLGILLPAEVSSRDLHRSGADTLAVVGSKVITEEQYAGWYADRLLRLGLTDNGETREQYLRNLVDDEILIAHARKLGLDRTKEALSELKRLETQELLNAFVERNISPGIEVTEADLRELFLKMNTRIKVSHLYAPTREQADSLYKELSRGKGFEELARSVFSDPRLRESGGSLGYVTVDELDPDFERVAFQMKAGEISRPVKTVQGYSIIRVEDVKRSLLVTESEFAKAEPRLKRFARKRKFEETVKQYSAALRRDLDIRFNEALLTRLFEMAKRRSLAYVLENERLSISGRDLKRIVVTSSVGGWTVEQLLGLLGQTAEGQRKWIHTRGNFEDCIAGLIMRSHIAQQARNEKLDSTRLYHDHVAYAFDTYLLQTVERELKKQISFATDSLRSYYEQHKEAFRTQAEVRLSGILVDRATLADSVRQMLERGDPFDVLATRFSIQRLTAAVGGDLGYYQRGELGTLGQDAFALGPNEWKGPFVEDGKYLFLQRTGFKDSAFRSFEESLQEIERTLVSMTWLRQKDRLVKSFERETRCVIYPERTMAISIPHFER